MSATAIMTLDGGLDVTFCTAVIGLHCIHKNDEMPTFFNSYGLDAALEGKSQILDGVRRVWSVGMDATQEQLGQLKEKGIQFAVVASPTSEESGAKLLMDSPIGDGLRKKGTYPNIVEVATLANVFSKRLLRTKEWSKARALNAALKAFGKCPWKTPDKFMVEWKMILSEPDALGILTDSGQAMCDWDDAAMQREVNGNGGWIEFAGSRWICLNGRADWLEGRDVKSPIEHDGVISWTWCPREGLWRVSFFNDGGANIQEALSVCASRTRIAKSFQYKSSSAVAYMQDIPFPLGEINYFWKFAK